MDIVPQSTTRLKPATPAICADGVARMRDLDLAGLIGLAQPRNIRQTIKRLVDAGKLPGVHVRTADVRTSMPRGGERLTRTEEFWLTRAQALKVIAKSDTDIADAILDEIIRVYEEATYGQASTDPLADLTGALARANRRQPGLVDSLRQNLGHALAEAERLNRRLSFGRLATGAPSFVVHVPFASVAEYAAAQRQGVAS